jgi:hypothetical protein
MTLWAIARACGAGDPDLQRAPSLFSVVQSSSTGYSTSSKSSVSNSSRTGTHGNGKDSMGASRGLFSTGMDSSGSSGGRGVVDGSNGLVGVGGGAVGASLHAPHASWAKGGRERALVSKLPAGFLEAAVAAVAKRMDDFGPQVCEREVCLGVKVYVSACLQGSLRLFICWRPSNNWTFHILMRCIKAALSTKGSQLLDLRT